MAPQSAKDSPLERYISILEMVAPFSQGLTAAEIEVALDLPKATVNRLLHALLDAGLTIERALTVLIEQAENLRLRDVLAGVRSEVLAGSAMSVALARHPRVFPELYRTIVRAGEESGKAAGVMARLTATVAPARIELARLRLEDVFVRIVAEDAHSDAVSRALRASVTAPSEGALA